VLNALVFSCAAVAQQNVALATARMTGSRMPCGKARTLQDGHLTNHYLTQEV